jgi:medium-chain acyl-[acyl-carrier-protein] hydrolase
MELLQFEREYRINVYETGPDGKLNLYSMFNYLQAVAADHANKLSFGRDDLLKENRFWVLSRMFAVVTVWPLWEETITVRTWPKGTDRLFALRDFEVRYPDGRHVASASSSWLVIDRTSKRVQRPDDILTRFNSELPSKNALPRNADKVEPATEDCITGDIFTVKTSDLDVNLHTNNVRYIKWVTDTYDLDFILNHSPVSLEVNYLSESVYGEKVLIKTSRENNNDCLRNHSVIRFNDNKELCRVRIEWENCIH